jgi:murein DD-endopeptidase MepM/ murein hydrolase activator NlpD
MNHRNGRWLLIAAFIVAACCAALVSFRLLVRHTRAPPPTPVVVEAPSESVAPPSAPAASASSTIIDLPCDPVLVRRGATVAPRSLHVDLPIALAPNAPKFDGTAFFVSTRMVSTDGGFMGRFLESSDNSDQATLAMAQLGADGNIDSDATLAAGFDDDGGANTPPYAESLLPNQTNSTQIDVKIGGASGQPQIKEAVIKTIVAEKISDLLIQAGYSDDSARAAEAAAKVVANIQSLPANSIAIVEGALDVSGAYRVAQMSLYENNEYVDAIALADAGGYGEGAQPNPPEGVLADSQGAQMAVAQYNLADGLYSAGVRNNIPEPVIREAIQLIGKLTDLKTPLQADENMRVLYSREFRGKSKSSGRVIYVGLAGPTGPVDCYAFAGPDGLFHCFDRRTGNVVVPNGGGVIPNSVGGIFPPIKGAPITSLFGMRFHPILHILRLHAGIDFGAPIGSVVRAVADGKIAIAGPVSGFGNHVRIKHNGFDTSYSHLSEIPSNITVGAAVTKGETVGLSGNTGLSTGPHLHFEYYINGSAVDPMPHMGTEVAGTVAASATTTTTVTTGPSEQDLAAFNASKTMVDAALEAAGH